MDTGRMRIILLSLMFGVGFVMGQGVEAPAEKKVEVKPQITFSKKVYYLSDKVEVNGASVINRYFLKAGSPMVNRLHLSQRFIVTKDSAKTSATRMKLQFEKRGKVTLVDEVVPNATGMIITEVGEKFSYVTLSVYEPSESGKGVIVKTYDLLAPKMTVEKLEKIVGEFQKKTLLAVSYTHLTLPTIYSV